MWVTVDVASQAEKASSWFVIGMHRVSTAFLVLGIRLFTPNQARLVRLTFDQRQFMTAT